MRMMAFQMAEVFGRAGQVSDALAASLGETLGRPHASTWASPAQASNGTACRGIAGVLKPGRAFDDCDLLGADWWRRGLNTVREAAFAPVNCL